MSVRRVISRYQGPAIAILPLTRGRTFQLVRRTPQPSKSAMDFLAAEIAKKRKEIESATDSSSPNKKFIRQKDILAEREKRYHEEQERLAKEREAKVAAKLEETRKREEAARLREARLKKEKEDELAAKRGEEKVMGDEDVMIRLRELGEPIRLFAETEEERRRRLEVVEERVAFERKKEARLRVAALDETQEPFENLTADAPELQISLADIKKNPSKLYDQLHRYFKVVCQEWSKSLDDRDIEIKESPEGKEALRVQQQCLEDFRPLFRALKRKDLEPVVLSLLSEILYYAQHREYVQASDAYYKLSIGNAAWPIGVVAVGIHERSSADRIQYASHVFNDEATRKWVQGVKRWLTFAQGKWPPSDRRKMMG